MIALVRFESDGLAAFAERFSFRTLLMTGAGVLTDSRITLLDGRTLTNKTLPAALERTDPDLVFGCEWLGERDHMDYPQHALRIQNARAIRDASALYLFTPRILERRTLEVARFNARVLLQAKVPIAFVSLAESEDELANPKDLDAIGTILKLSDEAIAQGRALLERLEQVRYSNAFSVETSR
jgi:hypothetical protein